MTLADYGSMSYIVDKLLKKDGTVVSWTEEIGKMLTQLTHYNVLTGLATDGSNTTLEDTSKFVLPNQFVGSTIEILTSATESYTSVITANTTNEFTFTALTGGKAVIAGYPYMITQPVESTNIIKWNGVAITPDDITLRFMALNDDTVKGLMKSLGDCGAGKNALTLLADIVTAITASGVDPTTLAIFQIPCTLASTEYSQAMPANLKAFRASIIGGIPGNYWTWSLETGKVATNLAGSKKVGHECEDGAENINLSAITNFYVCSDLAGAIVQLECWTA